MEDAYFSDGVAAELTRALRKIEGVDLAPAASLQTYKSSQENLRAIGEELKVGALLAGSVRRSADPLAISAQLIRAKDDKPLWQKSWERPLQDVFAIEEEIVQAVVQHLGIQPGKAPGLALVKPGTTSVAAYDAFLRGTYGFIVSSSANEATVRKPIALLQEAVSLDPEFARAHVALASAYWSYLMFIAPEDQAALKSGFAAVERASSLDPELAEAHFAHGMLAWTHSNHYAFPRAIKELKRALVMDQQMSGGWGQLGVIAAMAG